MSARNDLAPRRAAASRARLTGSRGVPLALVQDAVPAAPPALVAPAQSAAGEKRGRINPTKRVLRFVVPLNDGPTYLGDVDLAVTPDDRLSVAAPRFLQLLEPLLKPDVLARIRTAAGNEASIDEALLAREQIRLDYEPQTLSLRLVLPVPARRNRSLSMRSASSDGAPTLEPARFSAFVNLHSAVDLVERGPDRGILAPVSALDGAVRALGIVAEGENYLSFRRGDPLFRRTGSRLVYDDLGRTLRLTVGDARPFARYFQSSPSTAGLSIGRSYSLLEPQREIRSTGAQGLVLDAPSMVETIVNGRTVERKTLQPGAYTLQDFPVAEGSNDVRLLIEDQSGRRRTVDFSVYSNRSLLEPGLTEFNAFAGVYSYPTRSGIRYSRDWHVNGFVRRGLGPTLSVGLSGQADAWVQQVGGEALLGTPLGLVGFDLASSRRTGGAAGFATAVTFEKLVMSMSGERSQNFRAAVEFRTRRFAIPGALPGDEPLRWRAAVGYSLNFGRDRFVGVDAQVARDRVRGTSSSARLSGGLAISELFSVLGEFAHVRGDRKRENLIRLSLRRRIGSRGQARLDVDSRGRLGFSAQTSGGRGNGAWLADIELAREPGASALNANASYLANRAELGFQQSMSFTARGSLSGSRTTLRTATAIAFADGSFAVGRPVGGAFLLADGHPSLKGRPVRVDPQEKSEAAVSGRLGAALDGDLGAYSRRTLIYDVPGAPPGYDLGAGNVAVDPPYRGGYRLIVGSDYHLLVLGRLLDRDGQPIPLLAGKAIDLAAPKRPAVTMFTSRDGKFGAQGLRPGRWRIEMPTEGGPTVFEIDVNDSETGTVRMGDLRPVRQGRAGQ